MKTRTVHQDLKDGTVMAGHLTKADEKALLAEIIEHCPEGYVKDILTDCQFEIENAISSDLGFIDLASRRRECEEHREEMRKAKELLSVVKNEIREKEQDLRRAQYEMNGLRNTVERLSMILGGTK